MTKAKSNPSRLSAHYAIRILTLVVTGVLIYKIFLINLASSNNVFMYVVPGIIVLLYVILTLWRLFRKRELSRASNMLIGFFAIMILLAILAYATGLAMDIFGVRCSLFGEAISCTQGSPTMLLWLVVLSGFPIWIAAAWSVFAEYIDIKRNIK